MRMALAVLLLLQVACAVGEAPFTAEGAAVRAVVARSPYGTPWITPQEVCPSCSIFTESPFLSSSINEEEKEVSISMGVINTSGVFPVGGATIFAYAYKPDGSLVERCRLFTSSNGTAKFRYGGLAYNEEEGLRVRVIFCCADPVGLACVLSPCLGEDVASYAAIRECGDYAGRAWPSNATVQGQFMQLYPAMDEVVVPPKPAVAGWGFTFTLCFPLLAIFTFLGAAMYASGRDPFAMFSFYTPRFTRGAEKPIAGKGYTVPGTSISSIASTITRLSTREMTLKQLKEGMERRSLLAAGGKGGAEAGGFIREAKRVVEELGGTRRQIGETQITQPVSGAGAERAAVGVAGGELLPQVRPPAAGMDAGTFFLQLFALALQYSNAPWMTSGLAQAISGLVQKLENENLLEQANTNLNPLLDSAKVTRDSEGRMTRIEYTDPKTGERKVVEGAHECLVFWQTNVEQPLAALQSRNMDAAAELTAKAMEVINGQHAVTGARDILRAEGLREGGPTGEVLAALQALADPNTRPEERRQAWGRIAGSDVPIDLKIAAFAAATEGMNYKQLSEFLAANPAARELLVGLPALAATLKNSHDGNMLAALSIVAATLETAGGRRAEGQADAMGLGEIVGGIRQSIGECAGVEFGYRAGTEDVAGRMAAMGLANAALGVRASLEGVSIGSLSLETQGAVEAARVNGDVDVSKLSASARRELLGLLERELGKESGQYKAMEAAFEAYGQLSGASIDIMSGISKPGLEAARAVLSQAPPIIGEDGLPRADLAVGMPARFLGEGVVAALEGHGVDPGLASVLSALETTNAEGRAVGAMRQLADRLGSDPAEYARNMAEGYGQQKERLDEYRQNVEAALGILEDQNASEASRQWAQHVVEGVLHSADETIISGESPGELRQLASEALQNLSPQTIGAYLEGLSNQYSESQDRYRAAAELIANPTEAAAAEYARFMGDRVVPGLAERREEAHGAVETLRTSTDEHARMEAERTLRLLGAPDAYLGPLVEAPAGTQAYRESIIGTAAENVGKFVDQYYDNQRAMQVRPGDAQRIAFNNVLYAPENPDSMLNPGGLGANREAMAAEMQAAQAAIALDRNFQIAARGEEELHRFYDNMPYYRQVVEGAMERISQSRPPEGAAGAGEGEAAGGAPERRSSGSSGTRGRLDHRPEE